MKGVKSVRKNIDLNKIRNMSDESLYNYIHRLSKRRGNTCLKCGKQANYTLNIQNKKAYQQKKLCVLCEDCYDDLLDYLDCMDIIWD